MCFEPVHNLDAGQLTIALIELYAAFGADLLVVPLSALLSELRALLRTFEAVGRVRVKPAAEVPATLVSARSSWSAFIKTAVCSLEPKNHILKTRQKC